MPEQRPSPAVGENIAIFRKTRVPAVTQDSLARRARISVSLLSKIETGDRVASPPVVAAIAQALGTTTARLYFGSRPDTPVDLDPLRAAVRRYDIADTAREPVKREHLTAALAQAGSLRAATRYDELSVILPELLADATTHALATGDPVAWTLLADTYGCAYSLAHRLGQPDLAEAITARQEWATTRTWTPVAYAAAQWNRAGTFQSAGDYTHGLGIVENAVSALAAANLTDVPATVVQGSLHLRAVTLASRAKDQAATTDHLRHARALARKLPGGDVLIHNLTFGRGNTAMHELASLVELDKPDKAVDMAAAFVPGPGLRPTRMGHFHINAARAHLATGDRDAALSSLRAADDVAPQMARAHPMAREVGRVLVSMHRRSNPELMVMAARLGIDT
ncbi:helix-turn-helix domain-containing protein [Kitasatospora sp. CMC57]|uniref:helix-turn-helix domain-containing protein n=1 Tax=Kitasatospora sp. CMC57 TaxID=3231513 RepID=UPI0038B4826A